MTRKSKIWLQKGNEEDAADNSAAEEEITNSENQENQSSSSKNFTDENQTRKLAKRNRISEENEATSRILKRVPRTRSRRPQTELQNRRLTSQ